MIDEFIKAHPTGRTYNIALNPTVEADIVRSWQPCRIGDEYILELRVRTYFRSPDNTRISAAQDAARKRLFTAIYKNQLSMIPAIIEAAHAHDFDGVLNVISKLEKSMIGE